VAITGIVTAAHLVAQGGPALQRAGIFLSYVGVLAGASAQLGVRALRMKERIKSTPFDLLPPLLLVGGGVALVLFGLAQGKPLYILFAALGIVQGITHFRYWLTPPSHGREWFLAHMTAMGTSCITTVTAFVVTNARRLGMHTFDLPLWIIPIVLLGVGLGFWRRSYARRFTSAAKAA
jgi:hypothetical protein